MAVPALDGPLLCRVGFKGGKMAMSMARKADIIKEKKAQMESMISLLEAAYGCDRKEMKAAFQKYALLEEPLEDAMRKNREQFVRLFTPALVNLADYDWALRQMLEERIIK